MYRIYNTDIPATLWAYRFNREELRCIAKSHGIKRGRDKEETAYNISRGVDHQYGQHFAVKFEVELHVYTFQ